MVGKKQENAVADRKEVILETERLFLRKMTMEDFDSLYVVLADSDIMQHYPYALDEKRVRNDRRLWAYPSKYRRRDAA